MLQRCECTKMHWIVNFKMVHFMICELYDHKNTKKERYACSCAQSCSTLCGPVDCSPPSFSVHEIFSGKNIGVGSDFLFRGIFPIQGWNPCLLCLLHCRWILYHWAIREAPKLKLYIIMADSHHCTAKTNTTLQSNFPPIKNKLKKRRGIGLYLHLWLAKDKDR